VVTLTLASTRRTDSGRADVLTETTRTAEGVAPGPWPTSVCIGKTPTSVTGSAVSATVPEVIAIAATSARLVRPRERPELLTGRSSRPRRTS
jgi:hypothetical protein